MITPADIAAHIARKPPKRPSNTSYNPSKRRAHGYRGPLTRADLQAMTPASPAILRNRRHK